MSIWLDALFGAFKWYQIVKTVAIQVIVLAEATGEEGPVKKQKAIDAIQQVLAEDGQKIPLPDFLQDWLIGLMIDLIVYALNKKFGKDWIEKAKDILQLN